VVSRGENGGPVVLVLGPQSSFEVPDVPIPASVRDLGEFPLPERFPVLPPSFGEFLSQDNLPEISLEELVGSSNQENGCGLLCQVFKTLETQLGVTQIGGSQQTAKKDYDFQNSTSNEKVLQDGTVLRINETTIHDKSEDGHAFFFHSTVHHVQKENSGEEKIEEEDIAENQTSGENTDTVFELAREDDNEISDSIIEDEVARKFPTLDVGESDLFD